MEKNRPKDWWGNPDNAQLWIDQNKKKEDSGDSKLNTTLQSQYIVTDEIGKFIIANLRSDRKLRILEVGAGDGRLVGNLSKIYNQEEFSSCDINLKLSEHVHVNFPKVTVSVGQIIDLPYEDKYFDLVYTYQVLQHVSPEEIKLAIDEMTRVSRNEIWAWEGIGKTDLPHGTKTHNAHNGSFVWHVDKLAKCYEVSIPKNKEIALDRQRLYKIKKYA
jgi:ubiquinone/menaquinone biosynthesis C-methylase UbiE